MPGKEKIFTAGEKEYLNFTERSVKGIPVPDKLLEEMRALNESLCMNQFDKYLY